MACVTFGLCVCAIAAAFHWFGIDAICLYVVVTFAISAINVINAITNSI